MMPSLAGDIFSGRDAWATIAGFVYQVLRTVDRWIDLEEGSALLCEYGEDIYEETRAFGDMLDGNIQLEQIKHRSTDRITLRSPAVVEALANFAHYLDEAPAANLRFSFFTNAEVGTESGQEFPDGLPGILAWKAIRDGTLNSVQRKDALAAIKGLYASVSCPPGLTRRKQIFQAFVSRVTNDKALAEMIQLVEWSVSSVDLQVYLDRIPRKLTEAHLVGDMLAAQQLFYVLFFHVFHLLSQRGIKRLEKRELEALALEKTLVALDRAKVERLISVTDQLAESTPQILKTVQASQEQLFRLGEELRASTDRIVSFIGASPGASFSPPRSDEAPVLPEALASRARIMRRVQNLLKNSTAVVLVGEMGTGKSTLARLLIEQVPYQGRWCSLTGKDDAHFERQLAGWAQEVLGGDVWSAYISGQLRLAGLLVNLTKALDGRCLLVVDDLPGPDVPDGIANILNLVMDVFRSHGGKLVTTSYTVPASIQSHWGGQLAILDVSGLSRADIKEILTRARAPKRILDRRMIDLIAAVTRSHAGLVVQVVDWLRRNEWRLGSAEFAALFTDEPVRELKMEARLRAARILDDSSRELLYRLSIVSSKFDNELLEAVALVEPALPRPGESRDRLTGPWLTELADAHYSVPALFQYAGREILPAERLTRVHATIADHFLRREVIDASEAPEIASHLYKSGDFRRYIVFLGKLMMEIKNEHEARALSWIAGVRDPFVEMNHEDEIGLRFWFAAQQYRIGILAGVGVSTKHDLMEDLYRQAAPEDAQFVVHGLLMTGPLLQQSSAEMALRQSIRASRLVRLGGNVPPDTYGASPADIIWLSVWRLKGREDVQLFLDELGRMKEDERRDLFEADLAPETLEIVIDSCWSTELDKAAEDRDWPAVVRFLDTVRDAGRLPGAEPLVFVEARARAVVLADELGRQHEAVKYLDSVGHSGRPELDFLLAYTRGSIVADHIDARAAVEHFEFATNQNANSFLYFRLDALRRWGVGLALSRKFEDAIARYVEAIRTSKALGMLSHDRAELLGELAWVYRAVGASKRSAGCLYGAARILAEQGGASESERYREVYLKFAYSLQWFWKSASYPGTAMDKDWSPLPVAPGLFARRASKPPPSNLPLGYSLSPVFMLVGLLASALDLPRLARRAYSVSEGYATAEDLQGYFELSLHDRAGVESRVGDPVLAFEWGAAAARPMVAGFKNRKFEDLSQRERAEAERFVLPLVIGPALADIWGANQDPTDILDGWQTLVKRNDIGLVEPRFWSRVLKYLSALALLFTDRNIPQETELTAESNLIWALHHLVRCVSKQTQLKDAIAGQAAVVNYLYEQRLHHMIPGVGKVLLGFWIEVARDRAFAISQPRFVRDELDRVSRLHPIRIPAAVMIAAGNALRMSMPSDYRRVFDFWVKTPF